MAWEQERTLLWESRRSWKLLAMRSLMIYSFLQTESLLFIRVVDWPTVSTFSAVYSGLQLFLPQPRQVLVTRLGRYVFKQVPVSLGILKELQQSFGVLHARLRSMRWTSGPMRLCVLCPVFIEEATLLLLKIQMVFTHWMVKEWKICYACVFASLKMLQIFCSTQTNAWMHPASVRLTHKGFTYT